MIGSCGAHFLEEYAPVLQRLNESCVITDCDSTDITQCFHMSSPVERVYVYDCIGSKSRQDAPLPVRIADRMMIFQCVRGGISCT